MTRSELADFLKNEQHEINCTEDYVDGLIDKFEPSQTLAERREISFHGFSKMLTAESSFLFNPDQLVHHQNMDLPMCHYFVATSHNSYLLEGQLIGESSTDAYVDAFLKGCKSVELDCWDGADGEPVITHGYTLSKLIFTINLV